MNEQITRLIDLLESVGYLKKPRHCIVSLDDDSIMNTVKYCLQYEPGTFLLVECEGKTARFVVLPEYRVGEDPGARRIACELPDGPQIYFMNSAGEMHSFWEGSKGFARYVGATLWAQLADPIRKIFSHQSDLVRFLRTGDGAKRANAVTEMLLEPSKKTLPDKDTRFFNFLNERTARGVTAQEQLEAKYRALQPEKRYTMFLNRLLDAKVPFGSSESQRSMEIVFAVRVNDVPAHLFLESINGEIALIPSFLLSRPDSTYWDPADLVGIEWAITGRVPVYTSIHGTRWEARQWMYNKSSRKSV